MLIPNFIQKPQTVQAVQFTDKDSALAILSWAGTKVGTRISPFDSSVTALTVAGDGRLIQARKGWWIIKKADGKFTACSPEEFEKAYAAA